LGARPQRRRRLEAPPPLVATTVRAIVSLALLLLKYIHWCNGAEVNQPLSSRCLPTRTGAQPMTHVPRLPLPLGGRLCYWCWTAAPLRICTTLWRSSRTTASGCLLSGCVCCCWRNGLLVPFLLPCCLDCLAVVVQSLTHHGSI
jgi:hypothetical protein